jgi:chemotaxis protein MotA
VDIATIIGVLLGFTVITTAIIVGGGWQIFIHLPSLGITVGGTLCAAINRRDGALALEQEISKIDDFFFIKGLRMLVDGQEAESMRDIMSLEIQNLQYRHSTGKKILEFMGAAAPAFGMIGTLIGLIQMLRSLDSPDSIGGGMAVALLTTFYGALVANLIFLPLAGKLGIYSKAESTAMEMIAEGICAIAQGDNPTTVREKMQVFISQSRREEVKANI